VMVRKDDTSTRKCQDRSYSSSANDDALTFSGHCGNRQRQTVQCMVSFSDFPLKL
jgi:hypothetical protein